MVVIGDERIQLLKRIRFVVKAGLNCASLHSVEEQSRFSDPKSIRDLLSRILRDSLLNILYAEGELSEIRKHEL